MSEKLFQAVQNAAASSAMEGMPLNEQDFAIIQAIFDGSMTLQDYLSTLTAQTQAN